ncbi:MAG: glycoside hydrolase family 31 protein [Bacteroidales bacterium]|nr:glycoside hydrolase family 31 protein [Bacteroidales bacterium]
MKKTIIAMIIATGISLSPASAQQVTFYTPGTVRIVKTSDNKPYNFDNELSLVVTAKPENVKVKVSASGSIKTYKTDKLTVEVNTENQTVTFRDNKGNILMQEGKFAFESISNGPDKGKYKVSQSFALGANEPIYGIGLLQNGKMNLRGENRLMIQNNLEDYAHFFQSQKGYGVYWDNYSPTQITDKDDFKWESQVGDRIDYYFMYGGNADGVIHEMRKLSGHVPMLPLWTFGFHQSRERYKSSKELLEVVDRYRKDGVPFDGIIQDWQYWGNNYLWNGMDFLNEDFSNYRQMIDHVHDINAHISISIWASFGPMTLAFRELQEKNLLYSFQTWPQSGLSAWPPNMQYPSGVRCYDPYSQTARDIYWKHLSRLHKYGIDAWWMDSTDPDHLDFKDSDLDEVKPVTNPRTGKDQMQSWRSVRNAFALCTVQGIYDKQRASDSTKRVFILTRSYFAGQQRTGANTWSGDVSSSWDSFRKQIPICLNYTLTANPNVNTDLGGFFANAYNKGYVDQTACKNPMYQELYIRWMQFGTFCPMMRSHGTEVFRELYHFGANGEPVYDALLNAVKLRYKLLPYIYSQSWQVSKNDDSYMRALVMDFPDDQNVWDLNREFMFGRSILVAPVNKALYTPEQPNETDEMSGWNRNNKKLYIEGLTADWKADKNFEVYLPKGAKWYDFFTNKLYNGGVNIQADGTIDHCPVFVKAGSIVPLCGKDVQYANIADWETLDIMVYPGADADFTLYEDEGDGYNYEKGICSTIDFHWNNKTRTLTIGNRKGQFPGMKTTRKFNIGIIGGSSYTATYNGKKMNVALPLGY